MRRRGLPAGAALLGLAAAWPALAAELTVQEPRAFGYTVGDVVTRVVHLELPAGQSLDAASLPQDQRRGQAVELRRVGRRDSWQAGGRHVELSFEYQVLLSPPELRTLELPPIGLRVQGPARVEELRVDAWPLTVGPLSQAEARQREGLGDLRPDAAPPLVDTAAVRARLAVWGAAVLLALAWLAWLTLGLPWAARRRRPFARAWRSLGRLPAPATPEQRGAAYRGLHAALNETAGRVVFARDLDRFVADHAAFAGLRDELALFFQRSRQQFFAGADAAAPDRAPDDPPDQDRWLRGLCRRCRDAEQGGA